MGRQFDGYVGILLEYLHESVESLSRFGTQRSFVEIVEYIVYQHRRSYRCERKLQHVFVRLVALRHRYLFLMIQKTLACGEEYIFGAGLQYALKRAVATHAQLLVGAVAAHHIHQCGWQFVAVLLVHPSLHALYNLRIFKTIYVVPSAAVVAVGCKEATVVHTLECHTEVVGLRIERIAGMFYVVFAVLANGGNEYVESAHARMTVA